MCNTLDFNPALPGNDLYTGEPNWALMMIRSYFGKFLVRVHSWVTHVRIDIKIIESYFLELSVQTEQVVCL